MKPKSIKLPLKTSLALWVLTILLPLRSSAATSINQFGITWNFDKDYVAGQYANGDWWVLGPVKILSILPESTNTIGWIKNGSMLNPTAGTGPQGFDSSMPEGSLGPRYDPFLNVDPGITGQPITVPTGTIAKSISLDTRPSVRGTASRPQLKSMAYLTVVSTIPRTNSFRPPPCGTDKTSYWNAEDLDFTILQDHPVLPGATSLSTAEGWFARPWPSFIVDNQGRWIHPTENMPEYGRDSGRRLGQGGLVLHTKQGDKRTLMIRLVQIGIDTFGTINAGARFTGFGGINCGWKWPVVLAGLALKDPRILTVAHAGEFTRGQANPGQNFNFSFDRQTWYVTPSDVGRTLYTEDGRPREVYIASDIGKPEWGEQHWKQPVRDGRNWDASYRDLAFAGEFGGLLSALLIKGGREAWGWPVAFDYLDRYMKDVPNGPLGSLPNKLSAWEVAMYTTYRFQGRTPSAPNNLRAAP